MKDLPRPVMVPLLNPNELEAKLVSLAAEEGQFIEEGQVLCTLETTKSTTEVVADDSGYVIQLRYQEGQMVRAGDLLCYLSDSPDWRPPEAEGAPSETSMKNQDIPEGLRITQPALSLARRERIDLEQLPIGPLVTESMVSELVQTTRRSKSGFKEAQSEFDPMAMIIYGGGGHGKKLIDLIRALGVYQIAGIVDDGIAPIDEDGSANTVMGVPVLGGGDVLPELRAKGIRLAANGIGGIGSPDLRVQVFNDLAEEGFVCPALIHPKAFVEPSAVLSPGSQVFPLAYVGSLARLGFGVIVNNNAVLSHDCVMGSYANISPGALIAGNVEIGDGALIGMGATINLGLKVGVRARIGNGATVKQDVPNNSIVRAGSIWPT